MKYIETMIPGGGRVRTDRLTALACVSMLLISGCGGQTAATPSSAAPSAASPAASSPPPSTPASEAPSTVASAPTGGPVVIEEGALAITLPAGWFGLGVSDVTDEPTLDSLRTEVGSDSVDSLVSAFGQHPEYWLVAARISDESVLTAQVRDVNDFATWSSQQEQALIDAYGAVETTPVSTPKEGVSFSWTSSGFYQRVYGFERPGGRPRDVPGSRLRASHRWSVPIGLARRRD